MNLPFKRIISIIAGMAMLATACKKENKDVFPVGSFYIRQAATADTMQLSLITDAGKSLVTIKLEAATDRQYDEAHTAYFKADSLLINNFRQKYGAAELLPVSSYVFIRSVCSLPAGASKSEAAQLNIVNDVDLPPGKTYVLPVVLANVDGEKNAIRADARVIYIIVKTKGLYGIPLSQTGWSITSLSSESVTWKATAVLDNVTTNFWGPTAPLPQNVVIDMKAQYNISAIRYLPPNFLYVGLIAGTPTQVKVELSTDGAAWTDKGAFGLPALVATQQGLRLASPMTARYIRFTVLAIAPLTSTGTAQGITAAVGDIGANTP